MRWTTLVDEPVALTTSSAVFRSGEQVIASKPTATTLFQAWENNHWDPYAISFAEDRSDWETLPEGLRRRLGKVLQAFIIGEHTGLDLLSPVLAGAVNESSLRFLATQVADEARHSVFMMRLHDALWEENSPEKAVLENAWNSLTPSYHELNEFESKLARATLLNPGQYDSWVRQVSMFHLVTEGVLAYHGQRTLTRVLQRMGKLPGITTGFLAMGRDEARHVSFGLEALRTAVSEGKADEILNVISEILPMATTVDFESMAMSVADSRAARRSRAALEKLAGRRLRQIGLPQPLVASVLSDAHARGNVFLINAGFRADQFSE